MRNQHLPKRGSIAYKLWLAGIDINTAKTVGKTLDENGYHLVHPDSLGWDDINRFNAELRKGQGVFEDAGGFFLRAICSFLRIPTLDKEVMSYRDAAKALLEGEGIATDDEGVSVSAGMIKNEQ